MKTNYLTTTDTPTDYGEAVKDTIGIGKEVEETFNNPNPVDAYNKAHEQREKDKKNSQNIDDYIRVTTTDIYGIGDQITKFKQESKTNKLRETQQNRTQKKYNIIDKSIAAANAKIGLGGKTKRRRNKKSIKKSRKHRKRSHKRRH